MMTEESVSIIVPTYNNAKYIERCVDSLLKQTFSNIEIIIVDDGSTDDTEKILKDKINKYSNIKYYKNSNHGVSYSRNYGLDKATGKYIVFVDGDDWLPNDYIYNCHNFLKNNNLDVVRTGYKICSSQGEQEHVLFSENKLIDNKMKESCFLNTTFFNSCCTQFSKKSTFGKAKFSENIICGEDLLFSVEILNNTNKIGYLADNYYCYFYNTESITKKIDSNITLKKCHDIIKVLFSFYNYYFKPEDVSKKIFFELEHYIRRYVFESNESIRHLKGILCELFETSELQKSRAIFNDKRNKNMYSMKKWILVELMIHFTSLYLLVLKISKRFK